MKRTWLGALAGVGLAVAACGTADPDVRSFDAAPATPGDGTRATSTTLDRITAPPGATTPAGTTTAPPRDTVAEERTTTTEPDTTAAPLATIDPAIAEAVEPEIIDVGAAPLVLLRIHPVLNTATLETEELVQDLAIVVGGQRQALTNEIAVETRHLVERSRNGLIDTVDTVLSVDGGELLPADYGTFVFLTRRDDRGRILDVRPDPTTTLTPIQSRFVEALQTNWPQNALVLPLEPVGVGASWRSTVMVPLFNTRVPVERVIRITAIDGDVITYAVTSKITFEMDDPQDAFGPVFPGGTVTSATVTASGTGTGSLDLTLGVPEQRFELDLVIVLDGEVDGAAQTMRSTLHQRDVIRVTAT